MLKGIAQFEHTHRIWTSFHDDQAHSESDPRWFEEWNWDGVISRHTTPELVRVCAERGIPLVDLNDGEPYPRVPKIRPDNIAIGHLGAEHFIERGYQNFGFSGLSKEIWSRERRDGFVEAVRLVGRECSVFDADYVGDLNPVLENELTTRLGAWMRSLPKPVALMACFDVRALQLINAARAEGFLVPEEIAVLGVNNDAIRCERSDPALSSVVTNAFQSGFRAATVLRDMLDGKTPGVLEQRIEPIGVVTRHSTDFLAVDDRNVVAALSFIREQGCRGITVKQVLQRAHVSRSLLERKFRQYIGRSPQAEIRRVQLKSIRELLIETDFPLKRIAELTGFEHTEYMCVLFKRLTGETPGGYRTKMRDKSHAEAQGQEMIAV